MQNNLLLRVVEGKIELGNDAITLEMPFEVRDNQVCGLHGLKEQVWSCLSEQLKGLDQKALKAAFDRWNFTCLPVLHQSGSERSSVPMSLLTHDPKLLGQYIEQQKAFMELELQNVKMILNKLAEKRVQLATFSGANDLFLLYRIINGKFEGCLSKFRAQFRHWFPNFLDLYQIVNIPCVFNHLMRFFNVRNRGLKHLFETLVMTQDYQKCHYGHVCGQAHDAGFDAFMTAALHLRLFDILQNAQIVNEVSVTFAYFPLVQQELNRLAVYGCADALVFEPLGVTNHRQLVAKLDLQKEIKIDEPQYQDHFNQLHGTKLFQVYCKDKAAKKDLSRRTCLSWVKKQSYGAKVVFGRNAKGLQNGAFVSRCQAAKFAQKK